MVKFKSFTFIESVGLISLYKYFECNIWITEIDYKKIMSKKTCKQLSYILNHEQEELR